MKHLLNPLPAALLIALMLAPRVEAQERLLTAAFAVEPVTAARPNPRLRGRVEGAVGGFYGGVRAATPPGAEADASLDVYVGLRPRIGRTGMDLGLTGGTAAAGELAVTLDRPVGQRAHFGAGARFQADGSILRTRGEATVRVFRDTKIGATLAGQFSPGRSAPHAGMDFGLGIVKPLEQGSLSFRFVESSRAPSRAEIALRVRF